MRHKKYSSVGKDLTNEIYANDTFFTSKRTISTLALHCSATPVGQEFDAYDIDEWHLQRWGKNSGCGYHYVILLDGTIQKGRWVDYSGAHVRGQNRNTIGICYIGGVWDDNSPAYDHETPEQRESIIKLVNVLCSGYDLEPIVDLFGHNEYPNVNKACPCLSMGDLRHECQLDFEANGMYLTY